MSAAFMLWGCSKQKEAKAPLKVAVSADWPPHEFFDIEKNEIVGFDIDLVKLIGKELGYKVEIVDMDFAGIIPALSANKVDLAISGITRSKEREEVLDLTQDYYVPEFAFVSKTPVDYADPKNLVGFTVGAQMGTTHEMQLKALQKEMETEYKVEPFTYKSFAKAPDMVRELSDDRINAILIDLPLAKKVQAQHSTFVISPYLTQDLQGLTIALPKGSKLTPRVNAAIAKIKRNQKLYSNLKKKWGLKAG